ncbi:MAG: anthranilate synthase component I family protein [Bacteroidota bacterium]
MIEITFKKNTVRFQIENSDAFKQKALAWASQFEMVSYLDSNNYEDDSYGKYEALLAVGTASQILSTTSVSPFEGGQEEKSKLDPSFEKLKTLHVEKKDWLFGFLSYDLKNEIEYLKSENLDNINLPNLHFFQPKIVIEFFKNEIKIYTKEQSAISIFEAINHSSILSEAIFIEKEINRTDIKSSISKADYLNTISKIKSHIGLGDIYEMNFCQEFYVENASVNPYVLFEKFNKKGKAPFSAFYKFKNKYLLCASPERFLAKRGNKLISQPIKGTTKRGGTKEEDHILQQQLYNSPKDRSENVMIVDLVRNDLAKSCKAGSVQVEELFGIYPFEQVHQMISTVVGTLKDEVHFVDAIKNAYPMGSMTGAPKIRAMELIEEFEKTKRGLYSGAVGYITPDGDFDFNVVIRSMIYNQEKKYLSYQTGGAIVFDSIPENEYEECLLKAKGFFEMMNVNS